MSSSRLPAAAPCRVGHAGSRFPPLACADRFSARADSCKLVRHKAWGWICVVEASRAHSGRRAVTPSPPVAGRPCATAGGGRDGRRKRDGGRRARGQAEGARAGGGRDGRRRARWRAEGATPAVSRCDRRVSIVPPHRRPGVADRCATILSPPSIDFSRRVIPNVF